ncbi:sugar transporter domain-containing protein [Hirsutella rhossiliensis]|uniref:Sugar transporter domain-containing protein n=1 Tax=Hirsutella rhossiliensis TaxID=111463 RepID=A0A9P8MU87_9HYPO|nr:sugar transporter domain-containing protein [Hirsutella rhossiliensis]KAH0960326.1 sugar transporter domain-containing protein [Hirsutella rhossiliensis]
MPGEREKQPSAAAVSPCGGSDQEQTRTNSSSTTAILQNPLETMSNDEVVADADRFVEENGLVEHRQLFRRGCLAAKTQNIPDGFEGLVELTEADKAILRFEIKHQWKSSPRKLYLLCALCAGCAIVQGMDQTVINGAQSFYFEEFGITDKLMQGFVNGSPYAAAALLGCWLNAPLNDRWGRRGTIAVSCFLAFVTAIWQAVSKHWISFLVARLILGLAVGAKSSTTPVYAAESSPKSIRGALTMMWQMWTAFGIMLGFVVSLVFQKADFLGPHSQWRWMIGITALPPMIGDFKRAFDSLKLLRKHDIQAARDMYLAYKLLRPSEGQKGGWQLFKEFFTIRRNRRAAQSAWFCMFMQQFCGVNVIAYYSTKIFIDAGYSHESALLVSFGSGVCNFLGAIPAIFTIDRCGRRRLLLVTFPIMALLLFWTGSSFLIPDKNQRLAMVAASLYLFMILYSPGLGPVPFTYSAEAFPLHIRAVGMSSATAITWAFNFLISFTWPEMMDKFTATGGFYWYATWNIFGFVFAYFLVPETKNMTLEELDGVFSVRNRDHARYYAQKLRRLWKKMRGQDTEPIRPLYAFHASSAQSVVKDTGSSQAKDT